MVAATERDAWSMACEQIGCELLFVDSPVALDAKKPDAFVISALPRLEERATPLDAIAEQLRSDIGALIEREVIVFICSVFRACDDPGLLERIRRLDLQLAEISHETGAIVIDFDRVFAHEGARTLETDYRLHGARAAQLAGEAIVATLRETLDV